MSQADYVHKGEAITWTPNANVPRGEIVVVGELVGVAIHGATANQPATLTIEGVFTAPAVNNAAFAVGDQLFWDDTNNNMTKVASTHKFAGYSTVAKLQAGTSCEVKLASGLRGPQGPAGTPP